MHRIIRVLLTGLDGWQMTNCIANRLEGFALWNMPIKGPAKFGNNERPDAALRKAKMLQVVHLCENLIAQLG